MSEPAVRCEDCRGSRIGSQSHLSPNRHYCADTHSQMTSGLNVGQLARGKREETSETTKKCITNARRKSVEQKQGVAPETGLGWSRYRSRLNWTDAGILHQAQSCALAQNCALWLSKQGQTLRWRMNHTIGSEPDQNRHLCHSCWTSARYTTTKLKSG